MMMYSLVIARRRNKWLGLYNDSSKTFSILGSVVCQQGSGNVIVLYTIDSQTYYKKCMTLPHTMVRHGCRSSIQYENISNEDSPELLHFVNQPASAVLKIRIDHRQEEQKRFIKQKWAGLYAMAIQITLPTLFIGLIIQDNQESDGVMIYLFVAGIFLACHILLGLAGACFQFHFFFKRELLDGAKAVHSPRDTDHDTTILDEEQELGPLQAISEETESDLVSTTDESADNFVNDFMKGKFPRLDKAFG